MVSWPQSCTTFTSNSCYIYAKETYKADVERKTKEAVLPDVAFAAVRYVKREVGIRRPDAYMQKRPTYLTKRPIYLKKRPIYLEKRRIHLEKRLEKIFMEKTLRHCIRKKDMKETF